MTCLAFAISAAHEHARGHPEALSPEALFRGFEQRDAMAAARGTSMAVGLTAVEEDGQCDEAAWPYGEDEASDQNAEYYRARSDERVRKDLVDIISTKLAQGQSMVLALRLTEAWYTVGHDGAIPRPAAADRHLGGHAVVAVGYADSGRRILIRNSWGALWGDEGHAWLPDEYVERYVFEAVTLESLPARVAAPTS